MRLINHPVLCNYYLTYRCNATCNFCDIWERPSPYATLDTIRQNLVDLKKIGVKVIDFTGGEPLLHRQLPEILELAKSMKFITTVTTNALLYPKLADRLAGRVDMLHFSLDSADKSTHDSMRGVPCFDFVMESIRRAKELNERPDILFTVFEKNIPEIDRLYREICLPNDLMLLLNPVFHYHEVKSGEALQEEHLRTLARWGKQPNVFVNEAFLSLRRAGGNQIIDPVCKAGSSTVVITPDNKLVTPCYHLSVKEFAIDGNLYSVWNQNEVQEQLAMEGRYAECQGCTINCYMQPSFAVEMNRYWWQSLPSTLKYNWKKGTWKALF